ncbi:MAG: shikimate dehydrogenase [Dorea sp.]|nr:shikimate dehydrogenase [Dorea sp.]
MKKRISGTTTLLGLIGSPVGHSGSPAMHNYSFERLGLDYAYLAFDIKEEQVQQFLDTARLLHMRGFNVTMPCKTEVVRLVDELSPAAQIIGASNTVVNENGRLIGHNTDGIGFVRNLQEHGVRVKGKNITLMGGGGAGTAIFVQLALDGARRIDVLNRKGENYLKLEKMSEKLKEFAPECMVRVRDLADEAMLYESIRESDILINATKVGMKPNEGESLIKDTSVYREDLVVSEIIYNPKETKMMKDARKAGVQKIVGGKGMLLWQGVAAFKLFTGRDMPVEEVKELFFSEK